MDARTLRTWASNLCYIESTERSELSAAIDGHDESHLPAGIAWLMLDERPIGLGGIRMVFASGTISRSEFEGVFGRGEPLERIHPGAPAKYMTEVAPTAAPHRCTLIAEYRVDFDDVDLQGLYLRTERPRTVG